MNSDIQRQAIKTISVIETKLAPEYFSSLLKASIDTTFREYRYKLQPPIHHVGFMQVTSDFIKIIYREALNLAWILTDPDSEVMFLLHTHYRSGKYGLGYEAAVLDANDPMCGGMDFVLQELAAIIRNTEYQKFVNSVLTQYLPEGDWYLLCEIARQLQYQYDPALPEPLAECPPAQMVDLIPSLLMARISNQSLMQQVVSQP